MDINGFLLDTFHTGDKVTVNANELQALVRDKRQLTRKVKEQQSQIDTLKTALTSSRSKYAESCLILEALETKLDTCNTIYTVDLKC